MKRTIFVLAILTSCLGACGDEQRSQLDATVAAEPTTPASPTATDVPPTAAVVAQAKLPFAVSGPIDESVVAPIMRENVGDVSAVIDVATRKFWLIRRLPAVTPQPGVPPGVVRGWTPEGLLRLSFDNAREYLVDLDAGTTVIGPATNATVPHPNLVYVSQDGLWQFDHPRVGDGTIRDVFPAGEEPLFRLHNAAPIAWSPKGHILALTGDICLHNDLMTFDPDTEVLRNLTENEDRPTIGALWRPGTDSLATSLSSDVLEVVLVDTVSGDITHLASYGRAYRWSDDGARLHFGAHRSGCEAEPTRTMVERLR